MADSQRGPLSGPGRAARTVAFHRGAAISRAQFEQHVAAVGGQLPAGAFMVNLCEDRYHFLVAFAAAMRHRHTVLLPPSRAEQVVAEIAAANPGSYRCDDAMVSAGLASLSSQPPLPASIVPPDHVCMIGFTSGSTGQPKRLPKLWRSVSATTALSVAAIRAALAVDSDTPVSILATVPPQHMYGMEFSVLLPLIGDVAVHSGRPLFPADIAQALAEIPAPRVLVSTPVHLRALVDSVQEFPPSALIISATAPLEQELARRAERRLGGMLLEVFGSTETCAFANRRTASESAWRLHDGVTLRPGAESTVVDAPWFAEPMTLQDTVELQDDRHFVVRGRGADMIEVAGKRASLADLTRRLLAIESVTDAVVFQPDASAAGVRRVAALVVTSQLSAQDVLERLRDSVDPAFLPRPLRVVERLPRNELGKLPREALLAALRRTGN